MCNICCAELTPEEVLSRKIDREIKKDRINLQETIRLLLLGTGECGKTTILKQMKLMHNRTLFDKEKESKRNEIRSNLQEAIYTLVSNVSKLNLRYDSEKNTASAAVIESYGKNVPTITDEYKKHIKALWLDSAIRKCYRCSSDFQLLDSAEYFLERVDDICDPGYNPTDDDILHSRVTTIGISEVDFYVPITKNSSKTQRFIMIDVGGQRGERGKWTRVFHGIDAVLFITSCSDYDQGLRENYLVNRLRESIYVFKNMWQNPFLIQSGFIVFLNKQDLMEKKIRNGTLIGKTFPEYKNFNDSLVDKLDKNSSTSVEGNRHRCFIRQQFMNIAEKPFKIKILKGEETIEPRNCYFHFTVATSTENIRAVFDACKNMILNAKLQNHNTY